MKKLIIPCLFAVLIASAVNARAQRYETLSLPAVVAIANSPTNLATKPVIDYAAVDAALLVQDNG